MLPEDLIKISSLPDDPELDKAKPPKWVVESVRETVSGSEAPEELLIWVKNQRDLQYEASLEMTRLGSSEELADPAKRGLPSWITQEWSMVLRFPWSHKLAWAVESAKSWM